MAATEGSGEAMSEYDDLQVKGAMFLAAHGIIPMDLAFDIALHPDKIKKALESNPNAIVERVERWEKGEL